jgi:hypothetical protein
MMVSVMMNAITAAKQVADAAKEERTKRPHQESDSKCGEIGDERECIVAGWIELYGEYRCKRAEDVKVVPLDHGASGRAEDHTSETVGAGRANG